MSDKEPPDEEDPVVVGVPFGTPDAVPPPTTGFVTDRVDTETQVEIPDYRPTTEERATLAAGGERSNAEDDPEFEIAGPNSA
jgi:hypothetical protein